MDLILENDKQQGREMGWHGKTDVNPELSLDNCWLGKWDYQVKTVQVEGKDTSMRILGVSDVQDLYIGQSFSPNSFKPVFNARLIELLKKATEGKDCTLWSCGTVRNRGRQFFSFQLGESYRAAGRDFVPYFNIGNGNDKSSPLWQNTSTTCVVCDNTFNINMVTAGIIMEVRKTQNSELKIGDFAKAAKTMLNDQKEFAQALDKLALVPVTEDNAREFFAGFIGKPNQPMAVRTQNNVETLVSLFKSGKGNNGENFADVFSALTDYYTHLSASTEDDADAKWKNFVSSEFGNGSAQKQRAWAVLNNDRQRKDLGRIGKAILKATQAAIKAQELEEANAQ